MCPPAVLGIIGAIGALAGAGATIYSTHQQAKAADRQTRALQELNKPKVKTADTNSKTATTAKVNEPVQKRGLSSLRIPTNAASTVNMTDTSTGLNIPV